MSDIYKIAVKLTMQSNAAGVLSTLSSKLLGVHADVKNLEGRLWELNRVKLAVFGGLSIGAGIGLLGALKSVTDAAKDLNHELTSVGTMSKNALTSVGLQGNALSVARATAQAVHGTSLAGNVKLYKETYSMFGADADRINKPLAMFGQVLGGITGDYEGAQEKLYNMIRSGDLMGKLVNEKTHKVDADKLIRFLDVAAKIAAATGGKVGPDTFMQLAQQGGPALSTMSDEGLISMAMAAQGMGGFRAGTAISSLYAQVEGGKMTLPVAEEMKRLGLVKGFTTQRGGMSTSRKSNLIRRSLMRLKKIRCMRPRSFKITWHNTALKR